MRFLMSCKAQHIIFMNLLSSLLLTRHWRSFHSLSPIRLLRRQFLRETKDRQSPRTRKKNTVMRNGFYGRFVSKPFEKTTLFMRRWWWFADEESEKTASTVAKREVKMKCWNKVYVSETNGLASIMRCCSERELWLETLHVFLRSNASFIRAPGKIRLKKRASSAFVYWLKLKCKETKKL